jgi:integrase
VHTPFDPDFSTGGTIMGRRASNDFPRPRLHKRTGQARVRVAGREVWLGRWGSPEADFKYRQLLAAWATDGAAVEAVTPAPRRRHDPVAVAVPARDEQMTVGALLVRYLLEVKAERPVDRKHAKWWLARSIANALEGRRSIPLDEFGPKMLAEVQRELAEVPMPRKCGGHAKRSRAQVAKLVNGIRAMFQWAVAEELVTPDRLVALRSVKPPKRGHVREGDPREPVADEHIEAALAHMPPAAAAIVRFCRLTACRPSEAMSLRMADVEQLAGAWRWTLTKHKNSHRGKRRVVAIGQRAAAIAREWSAGKPAAALVFTRDGVGRRPSNRTTATIPIQGDPRKSMPWDAELLRKFVARACKAASIPVWTPYQLRHTALTKARNEAGLEAAAAVGGHAASRMTEEYARDTFLLAAQVAERIG